MEPEKIEVFSASYRDQRGIIVEVTGVDTANQRVIYRRPGYEHECVCPRREWSRKFERVEV